MAELRPEPQHQERQPGIETEMHPRPVYDGEMLRGSGKLKGKVAVVTGGDSGIGRSVCIAFAREGADLVMVYLDEHDDARETKEAVEKEGRRCVTLAGDLGEECFCVEVVEAALRNFGRIDVLVNNAGEQHQCESIEKIGTDQLLKTFRTNFFSYFFLTRAALPHMKRGAAIVNTTSVTAYKGHPLLIDYSSTKGAIVAFTRSMALSLADRGIRVNAVAPGPVWTPLIPASFDPEIVAKFGSSTAMKRMGQPVEIAPCYVFLATEESSFMTGQVLHPNGGEMVGG